MPPKRANKGGAGGQQQQQPLTQSLLQQQIQLNSLRALREMQQSQRHNVVNLLRYFALFLLGLGGMYGMYLYTNWMIAICFGSFLWKAGVFNFIDLMFNFMVNRSDMENYTNALRRADIMAEPIAKKMTEKGENEYLSYASSCMQGWRRTMEDAHTLKLLECGGFFGVYDGHSGNGTAQFCGENMFDFVSRTPAYSNGDFKKALYDGFVTIDKHLYNTPNQQRSGCTAVVLLVEEDQLLCANAGDSRCVLCRSGEAFPLSVDHKPFLETEQQRIERAGGYIWNRRVNGILALSRAIGDFGFKMNTQVPWDQQAVTSAPEVRTTHLNRDKDEFVVLACDGIWDMMSNEQVIEFVRHRIQQRIPLGEICEQLMETCLSPVPFGIGCDNMSVIIVQFKRQPPPRKAQSPIPIKSGSGSKNASPTSSLSGSLRERDNTNTSKRVVSSPLSGELDDVANGSKGSPTSLMASAAASSHLNGRDTLASPLGDEPAVFPKESSTSSFRSELEQLRNYVSSTHS